MRRLLTVVLASVVVAGGGGANLASSAAPVDPPVDVQVTGAGVSVYPSYEPGVSRYGIRTSADTSGLVHVRVEASPDSVVRINGVPADSGTSHAVDGLAPGDEVNVQVSGAGTTLNQSWLYLPDGFPRIETTAHGAGPEPGMVALTLQAPGGDSHATLVDEHGVPVHVATHDTITSDFNRQPNGHYSLAVALTEELWGNYVIEEYDEAFRKVGSHQMVGLPKTDFHETILLPDGHRILMAYIKAADGQTDSWLQEVSPDGRVLLSWNSRDHVDRVADPIENALGDYAHLNSIQVMSDGNLLLSFRHLNQVMKIDRGTGEVIWRLGGRRSDFAFSDDPLGGPCAQHTARELANGDIQIFDNGSAPGPVPSAPLCPDADDPTGDPVYRPSSRVVVYRLDHVGGEAQLVRSYPTGAFSQFAGSAQRLGANSLEDNVFIGLNNAEQLDPRQYGPGEAPDAIELGPDGAVLWTLTALGAATYRAVKVDAPDLTAPQVSMTVPHDGATFLQGHGRTASFRCSDAGGSNLHECIGSIADGAPLSDSVGVHRLVVRATDLQGNATTREVTYTVAPASGPSSAPMPGSPSAPSATPPTQAVPSAADAMIRKPGRRWKGRDVVGIKRQSISYRTRAGHSVVAQVKIRNRGTEPTRLSLDATTHRGLRGRWYVGSRDVTRKVVAGTFRTRRLAPGSSVRLRLVAQLRPRWSRRPSSLRLAAQGPADQASDVVRLRVTHT